MLRAHPDVSGFANTGVAEDEGQHLQNVLARDEETGGCGRFAFHPDARLTEESPLLGPANRDQLLRQWGAYLDLTKPVLLEKSPANMIRGRFLQALLPDARFAFIVRHPIAVCLAGQKMSRLSISELLLHWCVAHRLMLDDLPKLDHVVVIRYEDLVGEPHPWIEGAFRLAELSPVSTSEPTEDSNPYYFRAFAEQRARLGVETAVEMIRPTMEGFGYRMEPPFVVAKEEA
jgi:hypothetical protein